MTARIVTQTERRDLTHTIEGMECPALEGTYPAAHLQRSTAGQLWERVAVSTTQAAVYPRRLKTQLADNYMRDLGTRLDVELDAMVRVPYRGPLAAERADRSSVSAPYRHTGFECGAL